jgi:hypothetical protein
MSTQRNLITDDQRRDWRDNRDTTRDLDVEPPRELTDNDAEITEAREDDTGTYARPQTAPVAITTPAPRTNPAEQQQSSDLGTPYLPDQTSAQAGERWQRIQSEFVDDPRKAVTAAHELVGDLMQRVVDTFAKERNDLEHQWTDGTDVSTENLRVCMQRYRAFFSRLLPINEQSQRARDAG